MNTSGKIRRKTRSRGVVGTLFTLECVTAVRSKFYLFIIIILAVSLLIIHFIPNEVNLPSPLFIYSENVTDSSALLVASLEREGTRVSSEEELRDKVGARASNRGYLIRERDGILSVLLLHNGTLSERETAVHQARIRALYVDSVSPPTEAGKEIAAVDITVRLLGGKAEPLTNSMKLLLILLVFEVVVIGYLFSAAVIFQEKQEGTVRSFRVSPGGEGGYLAAKTLFWTVVGSLYGGVMLFASTLFSLPGAAWLHIMGAVILGALFYTLLGIAIAVYFSSISEWFMAGIGILAVNMLPVIALELPSRSFAFLKWIPSYPLLVWIEDVLRQSASAESLGGGIRFLPTAGKMILFTLLGAVFAVLSVRRKIMKEVA